MIKVDFLHLDEIEDELLEYAVIATRYQDNWVLVRHRERTTWEVPGGRREPGEEILKTAERELIEETGASQFYIEALCAYSVSVEDKTTYGLLAYAEVLDFGKTLTHEICERATFKELPRKLTYPLIQPLLLEYTKKYWMEKQLLSPQ